jgi:hypothetical protein
VPRSIACAVVHDDPPTVFIAEDVETLNWVLALKLFARTAGGELPAAVRAPLREAVRDERWGDAVELWMRIHPGEIDVYPSYDFYTARDVALAAEEIQFTPLFED